MSESKELLESAGLLYSGPEYTRHADGDLRVSDRYRHAVDRDMVQGDLDAGYSVDEIAAMELQSQSRREPEPEWG